MTKEQMISNLDQIKASQQDYLRELGIHMVDYIRTTLAKELSSSNRMDILEYVTKSIAVIGLLEFELEEWSDAFND